MENKDEKRNTISISELAKWGSIILAGFTGVILLSDWIYTLNYYSALGVSDLAGSAFLANPLHYYGFTYLWAGLLMVVGYCLTMILFVNLIIKPIFRKHIPRKFHIPIIFFLAIFTYMVGMVSSENSDNSSLSAEIIVIIPFLPIIPTLILIWFFGENYVKDNATRNVIFLAIILVSVNLFFIGFIVKFSSTAGKSEGEKILRGEQHLSIVALITKEKVVFSDKITVLQTDDGKWLYSPQFPKQPNTGNSIATLQFIGTDEKNIYVLDLWGSSVHAITKENIVQVIYLNFSRESLISSGINPIFLTTPAP